MTAEYDSVGRLRIGDVIVRPGRRYTVVGWTPRGKLRMSSPDLKNEVTGWWSYASSLPKRYEVWRGEERIR